MTLNHSSVIVLLAGVAFLLFGLSLASESLQKLAANRIRKILNKLDESGLVGVVVGTLLTLLMQSSGAVTATLVNLGGAGVLTLPQVMGVIIGTAIGAALTVQLLSLHVATFGLPLFLFSFIFGFVTKKRQWKYAFEFMMGLGLLFFGLELIRLGANAMIAIEIFSTGFAFLRENALAALALSCVLTSIFHSSTATLGIVMGLASAHAINVSDALVWIYGANIGTASTALIASVQANYMGKQIAWANFFYRLAAVALFLPFAGVAVFMVQDVALSPQFAIATIYLGLNLFAASVFFPLRKLGVRMIQKLIIPSESEKEFGVRFLKRSSYDSFALGLAHAKREILEMGDIVYQMAETSIEVFRDENPELVVKTHTLDDRVDLLLKEIKLFLIRVSEGAPEGLNQSVIDVISFGSDLEGAADIIDHHLLDLSKKMRKGRLEFSSEGWRDLLQLHQGVMRAISLSVTYFQTEDSNLAKQLEDLEREIRELEQRSRESHIARLSKGQGENMGTSGIYLETLATYLQLAEMMSRYALKQRSSVEYKRQGRQR